MEQCGQTGDGKVGKRWGINWTETLRAENVKGTKREEWEEVVMGARQEKGQSVCFPDWLKEKLSRGTRPPYPPPLPSTVPLCVSVPSVALSSSHLWFPPLIFAQEVLNEKQISCNGHPPTMEHVSGKRTHGHMRSEDTHRQMMVTELSLSTLKVFTQAQH